MLADDIEVLIQKEALCSVPATLDDVAREAGVSQQTVSRVLNNPEVVSERTRDKVIRAMQALHYVPNRSAQLLAGKAAPSIGLITASLTLHAPRKSPRR
jgi:DNA-binding LacI/PurR family transcriptional regulator